MCHTFSSKGQESFNFMAFNFMKLPSIVILEHKKIKSVSVSIFSLSMCHEAVGLDAMIFVFCMLRFKPIFSLFH